MTELFWTSGAFNVLWAVAAFFIARMCLIILDRSNGFNFKRWLTNASDSAVAVYLGFRILAICLLVGLIVQPPL